MHAGDGSAARRRVAVVTGGGGGIGSETCLELARQGVTVIAMDPGVGLAQMARSANDTPAAVEIEVMAISAESTAAGDLAALAALAARLAAAADTRGLRGAELVVGHGWAGLRSHPGPVATVSFGSTAIPDWVDAALRQAVS
jgi:NAD(P)-dependent dehydrogenase (short-subunit alcohol dehydrogenase family)